jgi:MoxR-like ATPase
MAARRSARGDEKVRMATVHNDDSEMLTQLRRRLGGRSIVMVGLMGCGKSSVGKRLAARLGLPVPQVLATVSVLEMRRLVRRLSGTAVMRL